MDTTGLNCTFVISKKPEEAQLSSRAVPILVFQLEDKKKHYFLKKWLKTNSENQFTLKTVLDWDYYLERFEHILQKIVVIPAILQGEENPLPEISCPAWLNKKIEIQNNPEK